MCAMIALSGCASSRNCSHDAKSMDNRHSSSTKGIKVPQGGAQWSGEAEDDTTVQFASVANNVLEETVPEFTFRIYRGNNAITAAGAMEIAFDGRLRSATCEASSPNDRVTVECDRDPLKYIRYINYNTHSTGEWTPFRNDHRPGGLTVSKIYSH